MANDPAFLFYPKDWLQGTAEMSADERGVYIDLLAHQQQENGLPVDTKRLARMARVSHDEFLKVWEFLSKKFQMEDGKLFNKKLQLVINGRSEYSEMRTIVGTFGRILKDIEMSPELRKEIKKSFDWKIYISAKSQQNLSSTISSWIDEIVANAAPKTAANKAATIGNGNAIGNGNIYNSSIEDNKEPNKEKFFFDLSVTEIENTSEYVHRVMQTLFTKEEIENKFIAFKIQYKNDFYANRNKVINHFRDWLKNPKNGHTINSTGNKSNSKVDALKRW